MKFLNNKIIMAGAFAMLGLSASLAHAEDRLIRFGSDAAYPPFEWTEPSGEITGFDIDIAKAMCAKLEAKCTFTNQGWNGIIPALRAKKYDVIASSMSVTPERERAVAFTNKVWSTPNVMIGKKESDITPTAEGTKGKDVGVQQGTIQDRYAAKYFKDAKLKRYQTYEDATNDLKAGRVQAVFGDAGVSEFFLKHNADSGLVQLGDIVPTKSDPEIFGPGTAFAVRKDDKQLLADLNKALDEIIKDGTYKKINDKYFSFDAYDEK